MSDIDIVRELLRSDIIQCIIHILKTDKRCIGNDALLIMRVCEKMGFCRYLRDSRGCNGWVFFEKDILNGILPSGRLETIRRDRQKVMQFGLLDRTDDYGRLKSDVCLEVF